MLKVTVTWICQPVLGGQQVAKICCEETERMSPSFLPLAVAIVFAARKYYAAHMTSTLGAASLVAG